MALPYPQLGRTCVVRTGILIYGVILFYSHALLRKIGAQWCMLTVDERSGSEASTRDNMHSNEQDFKLAAFRGELDEGACEPLMF